ncbi:MAG: toxin-antitoxin system YwqK family antitoxin [Methylobacter sp.]|nr:toxin-antitoxin system YwqK family antitoxin [Methylobacter sp.]MDP2099853.1 toxin-antitoxin system YwqK family antitoxin [Methylobacter sp.]MDP2429296.1 toxin-antitoxin system YwqK family antitoxin [Methylobacter sp.]MDP3055768.1 toxin-antitoxin system YwqK family antitoxin [Methylobacter sp.]MDP3363690.1 toxin-antitoxin system YwqK family antitoxin [Methylobacter sp.]
MTGWNEKGQKEVEINLKDDKENGLSTEWYENGQKKSEIEYKNGNRNGLMVGWHRNGQKHVEAHYIDGKLNGLSTTWYENGKKDLESNFKDGKENGLSGAWHENGQKKSEIEYKDGKENGLSKAWNENGQKIFEIYFKNGKMDGSAITWNKNGQKEMALNFKDGDINNKNIEIVTEIEEKASSPEQEIKKRCQTQMGEQGAEVVNACIDRDIQALIIIGSLYLKDHKAITERCIIQIGRKNGYAMIKACADLDIQVENALAKSDNNTQHQSIKTTNTIKEKKLVVKNNKVSMAIKSYINNNFGIPELEASWYKSIQDITVVSDVVFVKTNLASYSDKVSNICSGVSGFVFSNKNNQLGLQSIKIYSKNDTLLIHRDGVDGICYIR